MQIPLSAHLPMPKPAQLQAPGHTFERLATQHLPPPSSSVFSRQRQLIAKQEVVNTSPRPGLPADPDLRPPLCTFHELYSTRQNPPRGIPRTMQGAKSVLIRIPARSRDRRSLPYQSGNCSCRLTLTLIQGQRTDLGNEGTPRARDTEQGNWGAKFGGIERGHSECKRGWLVLTGL